MNKHYCFTDIHGNYGLWCQIRDYCDKTDTIYFLGDAADRGTNGIAIMLELMQDSRVHWILGNHDNYLLEYFYYYLEDKETREKIKKEWFENGGRPTFNAFNKLSKPTQEKLINYLLHSCTIFEKFQNNFNEIIWLSHAGFSPESKFISKHDYLWGRDHVKDDWTGQKNEYIVHGHTPMQFLKAEAGNKRTLQVEAPYAYADGHKIDLDYGTFATGKIILFDLDTLDWVVFAEAPTDVTFD